MPRFPFLASAAALLLLYSIYTPRGVTVIASPLQVVHQNLLVPETSSVRLSSDTASVCNSSTPGTSGFVDIDHSRHFFFWLHESRNDPSTDPVILWMTGGPGASSIGYGAMVELGPCRVQVDGNGTVPNPFAWNANATLLFVDQPLGVGFSYSDHLPTGLEDSTADMHRFLQRFFLEFPQLSDRDFYIAGESYGGSWVPSLGSYIVKHQASVSLSPFEQLEGDTATKRINLRGIMIGNGLVRESVQNPGGFEAMCSTPDSPMSAIECQRWAERALYCEHALQVCEPDNFLGTDCRDAQKKCSEMIQRLVSDQQFNPYDWRMRCEDPLNCLPEMSAIQTFLNQSRIKTALGVDTNRPWVGLAFDVFEQWEKSGDLWKSSHKQVNTLLDQGIRVLIYAGDKDMYCHTAGMRRLVNNGLTWHGAPFFYFQPMNEWRIDGKLAGVKKTWDELTYAEIFEAGHLAPYDKGPETQYLINSWISGSSASQ